MNKKLILIFVILALTAFAAFAQEPVPVEGAAAARTGVRWGVIGASFLLGIAAAAGAIGQGRAIAASVEGIARNPGAAAAIRLAMIIGLALIESLVIYALIIAYLMHEF